MKEIPTFVALGLLASAAGLAGPAWAHNDDCSDSAGGGGFGGVQEEDLSCSFACKKEAELAVEITSTDEDATVEGHAECGGADAECAGQEKCSATSGSDRSNQHSHTGDCYGSTSETYDSPVTITCDATGGEDEGDEDDCVVDCDDGGGGSLFQAASSPTSEHLPSEPPDHGSRITIHMLFPLAWGSICDSDGCTAVTPSCELTAGWTCTIG